MQDVALSEYGRASTVASPVSRMMAAFAADFREGVDINLGVGYVNEQTIPSDLIQEALAHVLRHPARFRAPFNYGGPAGAEHLIESIRRFYVHRRIGNLTDAILQTKQIVIGASGGTSILEAIADVLPQGIVLTSDPIYYIYANLLERRGFTIVAVPEDEAGIKTDLLQSALDELGRRQSQISFVYVVTVNNPTCSILSEDRRRQLVRIISSLCRRLNRRIPLLLDTAYELLIHDPAVAKLPSAMLYDEDAISYELGTLSKILAPALRIGYLIGPDSPLIDAVVQKVSDVGFSAPLANQAIASHLLENHVDDQVDRVNKGYRRKALAMRRGIDQNLGEHLGACRGGSAGFYYYLSFDEIETHEDSPFFSYLARTTGDPEIDGSSQEARPRVVYIPGEFCVHPKGRLVEAGKRQLRLSYGFEEMPCIERALKIMGKAAQYAKERQRAATCA